MELIIPEVNVESLTRFQQQCVAIEAEARAFACGTQTDYVIGDGKVGAIRKLEALLEEIHREPKRIAHQAHADICAAEKKYLAPLAAAKKLFGDAMLAWKRTEDQRLTAERRQLEAAEQRRAEDARLAQAAALETHANATGNQALKVEAVALLEQPLDLAPVVQQRAVPLGGSTKVVGRKVTEITDPLAFLVCVGATLLSRHAANYSTDPQALRTALESVVRPSAASVLDNPAFVEKIAAGFLPWVKAQVTAQGSLFTVPGVSTAVKEHLG